MRRAPLESHIPASVLFALFKGVCVWFELIKGCLSATMTYWFNMLQKPRVHSEVEDGKEDQCYTHLNTHKTKHLSGKSVATSETLKMVVLGFSVVTKKPSDRKVWLLP